MRIGNKIPLIYNKIPVYYGGGVPFLYAAIQYLTEITADGMFLDTSDGTTYNAELFSPIFNANGTDNTLTHPSLSGITITSSEGTSTPTINGNNIELTAGYINKLELSDGEVWYFQDYNKGDTDIVDFVGTNGTRLLLNGTITTSTIDTSKVYPATALNGYDVAVKTDGATSYIDTGVLMDTDTRVEWTGRTTTPVSNKRLMGSFDGSYIIYMWNYTTGYFFQYGAPGSVSTIAHTYTEPHVREGGSNCHKYESGKFVLNELSKTSTVRALDSSSSLIIGGVNFSGTRLPEVATETERFRAFKNDVLICDLIAIEEGTWIGNKRASENALYDLVSGEFKHGSTPLGVRRIVADSAKDNPTYSVPAYVQGTTDSIKGGNELSQNAALISLTSSWFEGTPYSNPIPYTELETDIESKQYAFSGNKTTNERKENVIYDKTIIDSLPDSQKIKLVQYFDINGESWYDESGELYTNDLDETLNLYTMPRLTDLTPSEANLILNISDPTTLNFSVDTSGAGTDTISFALGQVNGVFVNDIAVTYTETAGSITLATAYLTGDTVIVKYKTY